MDPQLAEKINALKKNRNQAMIQNGELLGALLQNESIDQFWNLLKTIPSNEQLCQLIKNDSILTSCDASILNTWDDVFLIQKKKQELLN